MENGIQLQEALCPHCATNLLDGLTVAKPRQLAACTKCKNGTLIEWVGPLPAVHRFEGANLETLAPPGSVMAGVFGTMDDAIAALPAFPEIPQRVITMAHDPLISLKEVAHVIREDPAFTVKVLRMANSAYFAPTQEIRDLGTACSRLGMRVLVNLAHAVANGALYQLRQPIARAMSAQLWQHAVATAYASQSLAEITKHAKPEDAFLAGLVHDVGKLLLLDMILCRYTGSTGMLGESPEHLNAVMRRFGGLVGLHVIQRWNLPPESAFASFFADVFEEVPAGPHADIAAIVSLASHMTETKGYGLSIEGEESYTRELEILELSDDRYEEISARLDELFMSTLPVLELS